MKSVLNILIVSILFILPSCGTKSAQEAVIQQSKKDLLAGTYKAVCYSGFRAGQHPDRGDGAINPSREEILEDLRILTDIEGFELDRKSVV